MPRRQAVRNTRRSSSRSEMDYKPSSWISRRKAQPHSRCPRCSFASSLPNLPGWLDSTLLPVSLQIPVEEIQHLLLAGAGTMQADRERRNGNDTPTHQFNSKTRRQTVSSPSEPADPRPRNPMNPQGIPHFQTVSRHKYAKAAKSENPPPDGQRNDDYLEHLSPG